MSYRTIYTCDKCGKEQETNEQMWTLGILLDPGVSQAYYYDSQIKIQYKQLWCRECITRFGLAFPRDEIAPKPSAQPTFEEILREIIRNECSSINQGK